MSQRVFAVFMTLLFVVIVAIPALAKGPVTRFYNYIYDPGQLKPVDSHIKVKVGDIAPDFALPALSGKSVKLSSFRGENNVVISFIPAAWTPICSGQWPGYNIVEKHFRDNDAVLLGISVDNVPTLYAWTEQIGGLWFEVLSDFWPHGDVADKYGVLRSDGMADRALIFINKEGVITGLQVADINIRPPLEYVFQELDRFSSR